MFGLCEYVFVYENKALSEVTNLGGWWNVASVGCLASIVCDVYRAWSQGSMITHDSNSFPRWHTAMLLLRHLPTPVTPYSHYIYTLGAYLTLPPYPSLVLLSLPYYSILVVSTL